MGPGYLMVHLLWPCARFLNIKTRQHRSPENCTRPKEVVRKTYSPFLLPAPQKQMGHRLLTSAWTPLLISLKFISLHIYQRGGEFLEGCDRSIPLCMPGAVPGTPVVLAEYFMNKGEVVTLTTLPQVTKGLIFTPTRHTGNTRAHL